MIRHTFKKAEKLTNKKTFDILFTNGKNFNVPPFRFIWIERNQIPSGPVQVGISVPKKSFAKASDRNTIKRRIREAYRKNKHFLYEILQNKNIQMALVILYIAKEELPYQEIEKKMVVSLQKMADQFK